MPERTSNSGSTAKKPCAFKSDEAGIFSIKSNALLSQAFSMVSALSSPKAIPILQVSSGGATSLHPLIISDLLVIRTHISYVPRSRSSIRYTPSESVPLLAIFVKLSSAVRSATVDEKEAPPRSMVPVREAGPGTGVSVGSGVAVRVAVDVGGTGVCVEVEVGVAVENKDSGPPHASEKTASIIETSSNCTPPDFIYLLLIV